jgi:hypothetical protein
MNLATILLGVALLLFGRRLFWLFVAAAGFLAGIEIAQVLLAHKPAWLQVTVAIGTGIFGALIATLAQRLAFGLAGFLAGGYLTLVLMHIFGLFGGGLLVLLIGATCGALAALLLMDPAIIILSSLVGAGAIVRGLHPGLLLGAILFVGLSLSGILFQNRRTDYPSATDH